MATITGNEPAMPLIEEDENKVQRSISPGLTIRQHYAGLAMQGILANHWCRNDFSKNIVALEFDLVAKQSVAYADALISALNSNQQQ
jgi:hypothetical protein